MRIRSLVLLSVALGLAPPLAGQADLSGVWRLDSARSTNLDRAFELHARNDGLRARGSLAGGQTATRQVPGVGSGVPDIPQSRPIAPEEAADLARPLVDQVDAFEWAQSDSAVVFLPLNLAHDNVFLMTDGKKRDVLLGMSAEEGQVKVEWKGERLRIERKAEQLQAKEEWSLADDGAVLVQDVEVKGRIMQKTLKYRRVYLRGM